MKTFIIRAGLIIIIVLFSIASFSQLRAVRILIGKNDAYVIKYLDSLNSLHPNQYFKIDKDFTGNGEMFLTAEFALVDQPIFTCYAIMVLFQRSPNGTQICTTEVITGNPEYAEGNLNYIKDNFNRVPNQQATWEKQYANGLPIKLMADFERKEGDTPAYVITYYIKEMKLESANP